MNELSTIITTMAAALACVAVLGGWAWYEIRLRIRVHSLWADREDAKTKLREMEAMREKLDLMRKFQADRGMEEAIEAGIIGHRKIQDSQP